MSLKRDMAYKWDFLIGNSAAVVYIIVQLSLIALIFGVGRISDIAGFSKFDIYFVLLLSEMVLFVVSVFGTNNFRLVRDQIHKGELDFFLTKPANAMFLSMFQSIGIKEGLVIIVYSLLLLPYTISRLSLVLEWREWLQISWIFVWSVAILMALYWITIYICFFIDRFFGLWWFLNNTMDLSHYPRDVYPEYLQWFMLYICPLFMIANPVYLVLAGMFSWLANLEMVTVTLVFCLIAVLMWKEGIKRYQSVA